MDIYQIALYNSALVVYNPALHQLPGQSALYERNFALLRILCRHKTKAPAISGKIAYGNDDMSATQAKAFVS